jgi:hypothetical protein
MTLQEAAQQALEALELAFEKDLTYLSDHAMIARQDVVRSRLAITALRAAIAEASGQDVQQEMEREPVAWTTMPHADDWLFVSGKKKLALSGEWHPLYTYPHRREWAGLTDEEMKQTCYETLSFDPYVIARAIEAKLKEKNS